MLWIFVRPRTATLSAMPRVLVGELMDRPDADPKQLAHALAYIRFVNRRLGGTEGLVRHLRDWLPALSSKKTITMLDIGTGSADIPLAAGAWAKAKGLTLRTTGLDFHETTLNLARAHVGTNPDITFLRADALQLGAIFPPRSFDIVHMGMFLHHLTDHDCLKVLRQAHRLTRFGLVWNDLIRSRASKAFLQLLLVGQPLMVRHDASVSIDAGFTLPESFLLARAAGWPAPRFRRGPLHYRFTVSSRIEP